MIKVGDELANSVTGLRPVFRKTAQDTSGEQLQVDWMGEPGCTTGLDHSIHARRSVSRYSPVSWAYGLKASSVSIAWGRGDHRAGGLRARSLERGRQRGARPGGF